MKRQGHEVYCLGVVGHADAKLAEVCNDFQWVGLARFGAALRYFKRHGVTEAVMRARSTGAALQPGLDQAHSHLRTLRMFVPHFLTRRKDCKDDTCCDRVRPNLPAGIRFPRHRIDYLAPSCWGRGNSPPAVLPGSGKHRFGLANRQELRAADIGQSVAVRDQA